MPPVVELTQASKVYRANGNAVYAVRDATLALESGTFTAVVGRSGCGKSTLLNLAGAVDLPTSGVVLIDSEPTAQMSDFALSRLRKKKVGFIFQFFHLLPTLTVAENVELPILLNGSEPRPELRRRTLQILAVLGIAEQSEQFPHQLSGGETQRAAIARAMIHDPKLIIADEPTGNLDSANAEAVLAFLKQACTERGHTILMATHSREAAAYASSVLEMKDGRLVR